MNTDILEASDLTDNDPTLDLTLDAWTSCEDFSQAQMGYLALLSTQIGSDQ